VDAEDEQEAVPRVRQLHGEGRGRALADPDLAEVRRRAADQRRASERNGFDAQALDAHVRSHLQLNAHGPAAHHGIQRSHAHVEGMSQIARRRRRAALRCGHGDTATECRHEHDESQRHRPVS
jgi:hypothetical protein